MSNHFNAIICLVVLIRYGSLILPIHACAVSCFFSPLSRSRACREGYTHYIPMNDGRKGKKTWLWQITCKILFWTTIKTRKSSFEAISFLFFFFFFISTKKFQQDIHANMHVQLIQSKNVHAKSANRSVR